MSENCQICKLTISFIGLSPFQNNNFVGKCLDHLAIVADDEQRDLVLLAVDLHLMHHAMCRAFIQGGRRFI